ncbi:Uncharacterised protein [uncultured archaeon]|nr:Uncharacterised protein [uncultured archaeon]
MGEGQNPYRILTKMRLLEICFLIGLYWALYLPTSMSLWLITGDGDLIGILSVGLFFTIIVTLSYVLMSLIAAIIREKPVEVEYEEEPVDLEPEPKMRTDVDLGQLDIDDDDVLG